MGTFNRMIDQGLISEERLEELEREAEFRSNEEARYRALQEQILNPVSFFRSPVILALGPRDNFEQGYNLGKVTISIEEWVEQYNICAKCVRNNLVNIFSQHNFFELKGIKTIQISYDVLNDNIYFIAKIWNNGTTFILGESTLIDVFKQEDPEIVNIDKSIFLS
jgi:hypothetical protein